MVQEICSSVDGPISAEVVSLKAQDMIPEAEALAAIHPNVIIKVPMTEEGLKAVSILSRQGIKTNVTLVFRQSGTACGKGEGGFCQPLCWENR